MHPKNHAARGPRSAAKLLLALLALVLVLVPGLASADDTGSGAGTGTGAGTVKNADGTLKFGMGPANHVPAKQVVDGRAYLVYAVNPGATVIDKVGILNYDTKPLTLTVYATDAVLSDTGIFGLLPAADTPSDAGSWIHLQVPKNKKITIPGRTGTKTYGVKYVSFTAHVPRTATPGDHAGGIIGSLQTVSRNKKGAKVTLDQRIGVRAYFAVTGTLTPRVTVENLKGSYQNGWDPLGRSSYTVSYYVHNTGNLQLNVTQALSLNRCILKLFCPAGKLVAHPAALPGLLPGARIKVTQTFDHKFGLGHPSVAVTLHSKAVDVTYKQAVPDVHESASFWAWPWMLILEILLLLLLIGLGAWRYERRRRAQARERAIAASRPRPKHAAPESEPSLGSRRAETRRATRSRSTGRATGGRPTGLTLFRRNHG